MGDERRTTMQGDFAVVHLCEALASGIVKVVVPIANQTAAAGLATVVVHGRRPETPVELAAMFDPRVRLVGVRGWGERSPYSAFASSIRAAATLRRELSRHERGVLHMHSTYAGLVGRLVPSPGWSRFYTPQGYAFLNASHPAPVRSLAFLTETLLAPRAHILACSLAEGARAAGLRGARQVSVVQNGLDTDSSKPFAPEPNSRFVVASVGRAAYQRRPDLFAELATLLRGEDAEFVWFGDGPGRGALADADVDVSGWLSQEDVAAAIVRTNVIVHFSAFEGLPLALLDAMTIGRAIVASDLPAIREVVGDTAVLVRSPAEAADAVRELRRDDALRQELAMGAYDRVRRLFTKEAMVGRTLAAYGLADLTGAAVAPGRARRP